MISLQVLQNSISKCSQNTKISLPDQKKDFVQNTAYNFKVKQLTHSVGINKLLNQIPDYTMQKEIDKLQDNIDNNDMDNQSISENLIPNSSLVLISENSTIELPETVLDIFGLAGICQEDYYIYGVRNPDSFYNSLLLQLKNSFILGKKNDKRNDVSTFKNEIVIKFDAFYKQLKYKTYGIVRTKFLNSILNQDNYVNYDVLLYLADYLQINLLVIDIIDMKYCNINYEKTQLSNFNQDIVSKQNIDFDNYNLDHDNDKCLTIIKYENDTYLPIMCKTGNHFINSSIIQLLKDKEWSHIYSDKFKERDIVIVDVAKENNTDIIADIVLENKDIELAALDKILEKVKANKDAKAKAKADKLIKPKKKEVKKADKEDDKKAVKKADKKAVKKADKKNIIDLPVEDLDDKLLKPKKKEVKRDNNRDDNKENNKNIINLPVEDLDEDNKDDKNTVTPANILSDKWIDIYCRVPSKSNFTKVTLDLMQNTAIYYGVPIFKKNKEGNEVKLTKLELAIAINKVYKNKNK
jgi:hypothetical protein